MELAPAIGGAVAFSAFLALSLSPMLASKILKPAQTGGWLARRVDAAMETLKRSYAASLDALLPAGPTSPRSKAALPASS